MSNVPLPRIRVRPAHGHGGSVTVASQFILGSHGQISGNGFINAGSFLSDGVITPGAQVGSVHQAGTLHISTPNVANLTSGGIRITLAGTTQGTTYDQIRFQGATMLHCPLTVDLANNFVPLLGNTFDILDLGTVSGAFTSVTLPPLLTGLSWDTSQLYANGSITVVPAGVPGDFSHDSKVDAADYVVWRKSNGSQSDYNTWRSHFGRRARGGNINPSRRRGGCGVRRIITGFKTSPRATSSESSASVSLAPRRAARRPLPAQLFLRLAFPI